MPFRIPWGTSEIMKVRFSTNREMSGLCLLTYGMGLLALIFIIAEAIPLVSVAQSRRRLSAGLPAPLSHRFHRPTGRPVSFPIDPLASRAHTPVATSLSAVQSSWPIKGLPPPTILSRLTQSLPWPGRAGIHSGNRSPTSSVRRFNSGSTDFRTFPRYPVPAAPGCALWSDGPSDNGLGDPAVAGSDAFWRTATLHVS